MHPGPRLSHLALVMLGIAIVLTMGGRHVSQGAARDAGTDRPMANVLRSAAFHGDTNRRLAETSLALSPVSPGLPALRPAQAAWERPPLSLTLMLLFTCCGVGGVVGVIVIGAVLAADTRKKDESEKLP